MAPPSISGGHQLLHGGGPGAIIDPPIRNVEIDVDRSLAATTMR